MVSGKFEVAYAEVGLLKSAPGQEDQLKLYALAKVAQGEDIKSAKAPGTFDFPGKAKRSAWQKEVDAGKSAAEAEKEYIELVESFKTKHGIRADSDLTAAEKSKLDAAKAKA